MTLEFSIAFILVAFVAFAGIVVLVVRSIGRDEDAYDDCTSERIPEEERAVTTIYRGEPFIKGFPPGTRPRR